ncbi:MAG: hypothetical protein AAF726_16760 [Planctomycetota bacterium]
MNRVILKSSGLKHEPNAEPRYAGATGEERRPDVRIVEVDGVVRAIEIVCSCGERTTVEIEVARSEQGGQS